MCSSDLEDIQLVNEDVEEEADLSDERYDYFKSHERIVLTVSEFGFGKRSSSYEFRQTSRGGKGIRATDVSQTEKIGRLVSLFPTDNDDQIMLVTDGGQVIRVPVKQISRSSRTSRGVTIFRTAEGEKVVSVERISEPQGDGDEVEEVSGSEVGGAVEGTGIDAASGESEAGKPASE